MFFISTPHKTPTSLHQFYYLCFEWESKQQTVWIDPSSSDLIPLVYLPESFVWNDNKCFYLGDWKQNQQTIPCIAERGNSSISIPDHWKQVSVRSLLNQMEETQFSLINYAAQIMTWDQTHRFCGKCGAKTNNHSKERAKICSQCEYIQYPRISPAVIVAIIRGDEILLARSPHFASGRYSVIAGFVESGESLEACVEREVQEEVGLQVKNIRYFGSQPWPFPHSLMIGFTAEYESGEIQRDPEEIEDAQWFHHQHMPQLPSKGSIAWKLVQWYLEQYPVEA